MILLSRNWHLNIYNSSSIYHVNPKNINYLNLCVLLSFHSSDSSFLLHFYIHIFLLLKQFGVLLFFFSFAVAYVDTSLWKLDAPTDPW